MVEPFIGKYYSQDYVRRNVLRQTDEEIKEQDELIKQEIKDGKIPDPAEVQAMKMPEAVESGGATHGRWTDALLFQLNLNHLRLQRW